MGDEGKRSTHKYSHKHKSDDHEHKSKKRHRRDGPEETRKHKKRKDKSEGNLGIVDDDVDDEDMWVEKNIDMEGERVCLFELATIATSLTSL